INHRNVKFLDSRLRGNDGGEGLLFRVNPCSFSFPDSRFRGNDEVEVTRNLKQAKPNGLDSRLRGNDEF
uniref:hypothetical protein n=1 Tax=Neisseria gonorrhoeae TaxID=485 RepID=UPI0027D99092